MTAFPILILVEVTDPMSYKIEWREMVCRTPSDIPNGVTFVVLKTNIEEE